MTELKFIVLEYDPRQMDGSDTQPARVDGHYLELSDAVEVADFWASEPLNKDTRIVVVSVEYEAKAPRHWPPNKGTSS